ncbi:MAG: DUF6261 family protein [Prevotellaceae bacterium]|jgi:hypothetical protein|nr:DUF6261 family protein [Prevotellaceae bacterium]
MNTSFIVRFRYESLRNEVHVEYNETVNGLLNRFDPKPLGFLSLYKVYNSAIDVERSALDIIRKSEYTAEIAAQDYVRDGIYRGLVDAVQSAKYHFNAFKRNAANRIDVVLKNGHNIAAKTLDQETVAIDDLLRELTGNYTSEVNTLAIGDWLAQLRMENDLLKQLMRERHPKVAQRPTPQMKVVRAETDKALRTLLDMVEALVLVNGEANYEELIRELNAISERYKHILAQEIGEDRHPLFIKD